MDMLGSHTILQVLERHSHSLSQGRHVETIQYER